MDTYDSLKAELLQINQDILTLFSDAKSITGMSDHSFADWQKTCSGIRKQMSEEIIRVAVIGPIKSGKSTFINALLKGDYLKRGAGIITSIVTRVRSGKILKAKLLFKSWDEVNSDMEQALVLFPSLNWRTEDDRFDIRRKKERAELQQALDSLGAEHLITNDVRNVNSVLLASYLKGYEKVKEMISSDTLTNQYEDQPFSEHWAFVGDEAMAVYLKDIQLEIDSGSIDSNIEIADCQGSDSPNPLHLAMVQDYLLQTHLIIYVVSSRTGLREADIKFLSIIKKMGILENILFAINCDLSEHESIDDLNALIEKVGEELSLIKPAPEIYSISSLYNLFKEQNMNLSQKDRMRLAQWEKEKEFVVFSDQETERFKSSFHDKLARERYALLLKNNLERLGVISYGVDHWIFVNQNILARDADSANKIIERVNHHQVKMNQIKSMIKSTLDGAGQKIKRELQKDIDRYFDVRSGDVLGDVVKFVRNYNISYHQYEENLKASGFSNTLYLVFQEFKHALDTFMTENINPEVIRFIGEKEIRIKEHFASIASPFDVMVKDAIVEYNNMMEGFGINRFQENRARIELPDIESIKNITGLALPFTTVSMRYTAKIKTEAVMRLGVYTVAKIFKKLFKKPIQSKNEEEILALKSGVLRIKRETEKSIVFHFKNYRENIKFQYIFKLVEAVSKSLYEALLDHFQAYVTDLSNIVELISNRQIDKGRASEILKEMALSSKEINDRINLVREKIESTVYMSS